LDSILSASELANVNDNDTICAKLNELNNIKVGDVIAIEVKDKDNRHNVINIKINSVNY
jgi:flagellar motor switch protein FliM